MEYDRFSIAARIWLHIVDKTSLFRTFHHFLAKNQNRAAPTFIINGLKLMCHTTLTILLDGYTRKVRDIYFVSKNDVKKQMYLLGNASPTSML